MVIPGQMALLDRLLRPLFSILLLAYSPLHPSPALMVLMAKVKTAPQVRSEQRAQVVLTEVR